MKITTIGLETWPRAFFRSTALMRRTRSWFASRFDGRKCCHFLPIAFLLVGIEACGTSHHWARELMKLGHEVRNGCAD